MLAKRLKDIQHKIQKGIVLKWGQKKDVDKYIRGFGDEVNALEETASFILEKSEEIDSTLDSMRTCQLDAEIFKTKIELIQGILNDFSFKGYSNLHLWVKTLEDRVEEVLKGRLGEIVEQWVSEFEHYKTKDKDRVLIRENTIHEIKVQNQTLFIEPSVEYARAFWLRHYHSCLGIITTLKKLDPNTYNNWNQTSGAKEDETYSHLLAELDPTVTRNSYERIDKTLGEAEKYVSTWLNYQALWEISNQDIFDKLGADIQVW